MGMKKIIKLWHLTWSEHNLLIKTFILLGLIRLVLWSLHIKILLKLLGYISQLSSKEKPLGLIQPKNIVWAVDLTSRYLPGQVKCLARALTTKMLMNHYGYNSQIKIGVAKGKQGDLEAHAWVESEGKVIIGFLRDLTRFSPMKSFKEESKQLIF